MWIGPGHATIATGRQRILEIQRGITHPDEHLTGGQVFGGSLDDLRLETATFGLADL